MSITIPYYNGQPMGIVPVGYFSEDSAPKQDTQETASIVREERDGKRDQEPDYEGIDYTSLSDDDLQKAFDQTQGKTAKNLGLGSMLAGATGVGAFVGIGNAVSASQIANEIEVRTGVRPETKGGLMSKVADFLTGADKDGSGISDSSGTSAPVSAPIPRERPDTGKGDSSGGTSAPVSAPIPRERPDNLGGNSSAGSSTDKEDNEKDNGGFSGGPKGRGESGNE
jgi:hypothetical protein